MDQMKRNLIIKLMMMVFTVAYIVSPLDFPGLVDDLIFFMLNLVLQRMIRLPEKKEYPSKAPG